MKYTEMHEAVINRAKEFIKSAGFSIWDYDNLEIENDKIHIYIDEGFEITNLTCISVLVDEFNDNESGIERFKVRLRKEKEEERKRIEERNKLIEERNRQSRYEMYLKYKEEFENENI